MVISNLSLWIHLNFKVYLGEVLLDKGQNAKARKHWNRGARTSHLAGDSPKRRLKIENQFCSDLKQAIGGGK